jgi:hypothetical protein
LRQSLTDEALAAAIGEALVEELGGSRRATKTIMTWTGVSDHTARSWLHGRSCPGGRHLVLLCAQSDAVMHCILRFGGRQGLKVALDLRAAEATLACVLDEIRAMRGE